MTAQMRVRNVGEIWKSTEDAFAIVIKYVIIQGDVFGDMSEKGVYTKRQLINLV